MSDRNDRTVQQPTRVGAHLLDDVFGDLVCRRCGRVWTAQSFLPPQEIECDPENEVSNVRWLATEMGTDPGRPPS